MSAVLIEEKKYPEQLARRFYMGKDAKLSGISRRVFDRKKGHYYLMKGPFTTEQQSLQPYILNEARMLLRLKGIEGIPKLEGLVRAEGRTWLLQQWLKGICPIMSAGKGIQAAARTVAQLAPILAACHGRGVCHCDLHPANLGYSDGRLWLFDFGAALSAGTLYPYRRQLSYGFASPALLKGEGKVSFADDNFSLLILAWAIWTGSHPFNGRVPADTTVAVELLNRPDGMNRRDFNWFKSNLAHPESVSLGDIFIRAKSWA